MNKISKDRIALAKKNLNRFKSPQLLAALVTGSVAKGYADDFSDIDVLILYKKKLSKKQFDKIIKDAEASGGGLYHGTPETGFAVYYYIDGIKCDFAIGNYRETEKLISDMLKNPEVDLIKHLQIAGIIDGYILKGKKWLHKWINKAHKFPPELKTMLVKQHLKFYPKWVFEKMAVERKDILFYQESLLESISGIIGILCGLNGMYHPGKLKGAEYTIKRMNIKPKNFVNRYKKIFSLSGKKAVNELFSLINETIALVDKYMPEVSTERVKTVQKMVLRKKAISN